MSEIFRKVSQSLLRFLVSTRMIVVGLFLAANFSALAAISLAPPHDEWLGMYINGKKVGYAHTAVTPIVHDGTPAYQEVSYSILNLSMFGQNVQQEANSTTLSDPKHQPLHQVIDVSSNGSKLHVVATYDYKAHKIQCQLGVGAGATTKSINIPDGADLAGDPELATNGHKLQIGQNFDVYVLDPTTIALDKIHVEITGRQEVVNESGKRVPSFVVKEATPVGESIEWVTETGETIREELSLGPVKLTTTSETRKHATDSAFVSPSVSSAPSPAYVPSGDFAVATSVRPDKAIESPRTTKALKVVLSGVPNKKLVIDDDRQRVLVPPTGDAGPFAATLQITAETVDRTSAPSLPIKDAALSRYISKAPYLDTDSAELRSTAVRICGSEKNSYSAALLIRDWVHQNMTPDASIGVPRSATDVFTRRRGVCRDYATLFAALARCAGIPTRLCAGVVFGEVSSTPAFYYHAWDEIWVGKWVAVDPTLYDASLGIDYVDATHIKLAQGDVTDMFDAVTVIGRLKISLP